MTLRAVKNALFLLVLVLPMQARLTGGEVWIEANPATITEPTSTSYTTGIRPFKVMCLGSVGAGLTVNLAISGTASKLVVGGSSPGDYQLMLAYPNSPTSLYPPSNANPLPLVIGSSKVLTPGTYWNEIAMNVYMDALVEGSQSATLTIQPSASYTIRPGFGSVTVRCLDPGYVNTPPTIATQPTASPANVTSGNTTTLLVLGADNTGESELKYTWQSSGPAPVTFGATNGSNAGKSLLATFAASGTYDFWATALDPDGAQIVSALVTVTVTLPPAPPTVAVAAAALENPTIGKVIPLSVLGSDSQGEVNLTYTWSIIGSPPAPVTYSVNGNNSAKYTAAKLTKSGSYTFLCTITDANSQSVTSSVTVQVNQGVAKFAVTTGTPTTDGRKMQFLAALTDQFGLPMASQTVSWSVSGGGSISSTGLYQATSGTGGPYVVTATSVSYPATAKANVYKTSNRLIATTGSQLTINGQSFSRKVTISGPAGNTVLNIIHGTLSGGATSITQGSPLSGTYSIIPTPGFSDVYLAVGAVAVEPPVVPRITAMSMPSRGPGLPNSIPVFGADVPFTVTINPPLDPGTMLGGLQTGNDLGGELRGQIAPGALGLAGGVIQVGGISQTPPGQHQTLELLLADGDVLARSAEFTVCAHIAPGWRILAAPKYRGTYKPPKDGYYGAVLREQFKSDALTGNPIFLDKAFYWEKVQETVHNAVFTVPIEVQPAPLNNLLGLIDDFIMTHKNNVAAGLTGHLIVNQVWTCHCERCGSPSFSIGSSGFSHDFYSWPYSGVPATQYLQLTTIPIATTVGVFTTSAGLVNPGVELQYTTPIP